MVDNPSGDCIMGSANVETVMHVRAFQYRGTVLAAMVVLSFYRPAEAG